MSEANARMVGDGVGEKERKERLLELQGRLVVERERKESEKEERV